jgi:hypothetical protein
MAGYGFRKWTGCPNSDGPTCTLKLRGPATVKATFAKQPKFKLKIAKSKGGLIASNPTGLRCGYNARTCSASFVSGTEVQLTATQTRRSI